jgi:peroxiredoxin
LAKYTLAALVLVLLVVAVVVSRKMQTPAALQHPSVGQTMDDFAVQPLTGAASPFNLSDLRGQVVLISVWGPWCPACLQELPELVEMADRLPRGDQFRWIPLTVSANQEEDDVSELRESTGALLSHEGWTHLETYWDPDGSARMAVAKLLKSMTVALPVTIVLDKQHTVRGVWTGYAPDDAADIEAVVRRLLAVEA